jgi:hypothetical protein
MPKETQLCGYTNDRGNYKLDNMIKYGFLILLGLLSVKAISQDIIKAGDYLDSNYYHVTYSPSIVLKGNMRDTMDLNGDGQFELGIRTIDKVCDDRPPFCYNELSTLLYLFDNKFQLAENQHGIKTFNNHDTIKVLNEEWWLDNNFEYLIVNISGASFYNDNWLNKINSFIGFRILGSQDTISGWIKLSVYSFNNIEIYETFCQSEITIDTTIINKTTNISNNQVDNIKLYPNPANDFLFIDGLENMIFSTSIYNLQGQKIMNEECSKNKIDISNLHDGLYFIKIIKDDKYFLKTIIKNNYH